MLIPLIVLAFVFLLIAFRQVGNRALPIWQIMLSGAVAVLVTGQIPLPAAAEAIQWNVISFLFGVFVVGQALEESGYLEDLSYRVFRRARSLDGLLALILAGSGLGSVFLMNDTLAIIGTPVVLALARRNGVSPKLLLLSLAFGITIGSVTSPIGNPQNLLIALGGGVGNSFVVFARWLFLPTAAGLVAAYLLLKFSYRNQFHGQALNHWRTPVTDPGLARVARISLLILLVLVAVKVALVVLESGVQMPLVVIALVPAAPILLFSRRRWGILRRVDWRTLVFFAAMFVLMESVWRTGFFQSLMDEWRLNLRSPAVLMTVSVGLSQFISNVPLVALLQPMLVHAGTSVRELMALAAGSTVAGNLTILGAASNVIIIQNAEKKGGQTLTFLEFSRIGIPVTLMNVLLFWLCFRLV